MLPPASETPIVRRSERIARKAKSPRSIVCNGFPACPCGDCGTQLPLRGPAKRQKTSEISSDDPEFVAVVEELQLAFELLSASIPATMSVTHIPDPAIVSEPTVIIESSMADVEPTLIIEQAHSNLCSCDNCLAELDSVERDDFRKALASVTQAAMVELSDDDDQVHHLDGCSCSLCLDEYGCSDCESQSHSSTAGHQDDDVICIGSGVNFSLSYKEYRHIPRITSDNFIDLSGDDDDSSDSDMDSMGPRFNRYTSYSVETGIVYL